MANTHILNLFNIKYFISEEKILLMAIEKW